MNGTPRLLFTLGILQVCALLFRKLSLGYVGIYLCFDNSFLQSDSWQMCYFIELPLNQVITSRTAERMVIPSFFLFIDNWKCFSLNLQWVYREVHVPGKFLCVYIITLYPWGNAFAGYMVIYQKICHFPHLIPLRECRNHQIVLICLKNATGVDFKRSDAGSASVSPRPISVLSSSAKNLFRHFP